ncbi:histone methylation DOT1, partial [Lentinula raphanica]
PQHAYISMFEHCFRQRVGPTYHMVKMPSSLEETYGELEFSFLQTLFERAELSSNSFFVDLGSGVGQTVAYAALSTGCKGFGIEIRPPVSKIAEALLKDLLQRCSLWGVSIGSIELLEGDMLVHERVTQVVKEADVVLINNLKFPPTMTEKLRPILSCMKQGSVVVSLEPMFLGRSRTQKISSKTLDSSFDGFSTAKLDYKEGDVSWKHAGGVYYWQVKV